MDKIYKIYDTVRQRYYAGGSQWDNVGKFYKTKRSASQGFTYAKSGLVRLSAMLSRGQGQYIDRFMFNPSDCVVQEYSLILTANTPCVK